ncbi:MAG: hypothetical protein FWC91_10640 [Defluviitaleaceae bacterium]|nr:hypothetical protein [Defluviitaleaceae bacterium]
MDDRKQQYLELLNKRLGYLQQMLQLTQKNTFDNPNTDEETMLKEAEEFSNLYEGRGRIVTRIEKIDAELVQYKDLEGDEALAKEVNSIKENVNTIAAAIIELDKKNMALSAKFTGFMRDNLKKIRDGREVSSIYNVESSSGNYFDSQK